MSHTEMIIASILSNLFAILLLLLSWKKKNIARLLYAILFVWAAVTNWKISHNDPSVYMDYGKFALAPYKDFIYGSFSDHITGFVSIIAIAQLLIGLCLLAKGLLVKLASIGGIIFLLCIAPLGLGAAFPFSLIAASGLYILFQYDFKSDILRGRWLA